MTVVRNTARDAAGQPVAGVVVVAELASGATAGYTADGTVIQRARTVADTDGRWELNLVPNSAILPAGSHYVISERTPASTHAHTAVVPPAGPVTLREVLAAPPPPLEPLIPIGGGSGGVSSVDGMTGAVSLASRYAPPVHLHDGVYSRIEHAHTGYSPTSHAHDERYSGLAHDHEGVYAHTEHAHTGYSPTSHLHDDKYSGVGHAHSGFAPTVHLHDDRYPPIVHSHDAQYAALAHNHDLRNDTRYSATGHVHTGYAAVEHGHDASAITSGIIDAARLPAASGSSPAGTLAQRPISGRWAVTPPMGPVLASVPIAAGELALVPFIVAADFTGTEFSLEVSGSAVGAKLQFVIHRSTPGTFQPAERAADLGLLDATSNGKLNWTAATPFPFTAGVWWLGPLCLAPPGSVVNLRGASTWHPLVYTDAAPSGTSSASAYAQTGLASPPAVFTGISPRGAPRVAVRAA